MARNRYGWQKRAKELARKQKHDDKIKRRQGKTLTPSGEYMREPSEVDLNNQMETNPDGLEISSEPSPPD